MNSTLEGTNSRITEAEDWRSDMKDRMVKITATEQNREKRMERKKKTSQETSGTTLNAPAFTL